MEKTPVGSTHSCPGLKYGVHTALPFHKKKTREVEAQQIVGHALQNISKPSPSLKDNLICSTILHLCFMSMTFRIVDSSYVPISQDIPDDTYILKRTHCDLCNIRLYNKLLLLIFNHLDHWLDKLHTAKCSDLYKYRS